VTFRRWPGRRDRSRGLVCLASNENSGLFDCNWYRGLDEDHLVEQATLPDLDSAIGWGRDRTGRVRVRNHGRTAWVGSDSLLEGREPQWNASTHRNVGPLPGASRDPRDYRR
jgi:hypothetical protein